MGRPEDLEPGNGLGKQVQCFFNKTAKQPKNARKILNCEKKYKVDMSLFENYSSRVVPKTLMMCLTSLAGLVSQMKSWFSIELREITANRKSQENTKSDCSTCSLDRFSSSCLFPCFIRFIVLFLSQWCLCPKFVTYLASVKRKATFHAQVLVLHAPKHECIPLDDYGNWGIVWTFW